jgi:hypothetical protein
VLGVPRRHVGLLQPAGAGGHVRHYFDARRAQVGTCATISTPVVRRSNRNSETDSWARVAPKGCQAVHFLDGLGDAWIRVGVLQRQRGRGDGMGPSTTPRCFRSVSRARG